MVDLSSERVWCVGGDFLGKKWRDVGDGFPGEKWRDMENFNCIRDDESLHSGQKPNSENNFFNLIKIVTPWFRPPIALNYI